MLNFLKKTLIGGFSCVNTRLAFDLKILLPNNKKQDLKVMYGLKTDGKKQNKCVVSKILKMNKNNQNGNGRTKPLPHGCIKKGKNTNFILQNLLVDDKIGHLFVVDIVFDEKMQMKKL